MGGWEQMFDLMNRRSKPDYDERDDYPPHWL